MSTPEKPPKKNGGILSDKAARIIIYIVVAVWAGTTVAGVFKINGYQPPESINGIFLAVVGTVLLARTKSGDDS